MHDDPFNLQRFVDAQQGTAATPLIERVRAELAHGRKTSHWMWFVFPQIGGLGSSEMSRRYAITSPAEARAYLDHPVLGPRLVECCGLVMQIEDRSAHEIFGAPDDVKLHSSMTLFAAVSPNGIFDDVLQKYFGATPDRATLQRL
jgi:uncharacterized protein (DUF1810 family)